jgi:predicted 3-demethylubiquinone-9 3-methyltransferase (glyoxalase superfamily)
MSRIVPNLWYTDKAEEAAAFYASILPNSKVDAVTALPADSPSGPAGSVKIVELTLMGQWPLARARLTRLIIQYRSWFSATIKPK